MDNGGEIEAQALEFQKIEEVFEDRGSEFFDTLLSFGSINQLKTKIKTFEDQGTDLHGVCRSHFYFFLYETNPNFLYFVEWCLSNYYSSEIVVMESAKKFFWCLLNSLVVWYSLIVPPLFTLCREYFNEET